MQPSASTALGPGGPTRQATRWPCLMGQRVSLFFLACSPGQRKLIHLVAAIFRPERSRCDSLLGQFQNERC
jgi:hypothetical protein